ncbi:hypothetical protein BD311DRAFT_758928 [Dichomitus squalens]|uniref:Uncharacterized protein n=1 Tax=Dichomitus squalens TaxID=114155 RepID=A0A4V2K0A9_9APHY|nr:hypothetical protein BD311DRAFT_758928 [Dichomitus squalens]
MTRSRAPQLTHLRCITICLIFGSTSLASYVLGSLHLAAATFNLVYLAWDFALSEACGARGNVQATIAGHETRPSIMHDLAVMRLRDFSNLRTARWQGTLFNGLQVTRTTLWLVWNVGLLAQAVGEKGQDVKG